MRIKAINPFTNELLPVFISKSHDFGDHLDNHIGIPSANESDRTFAEKHGLKVTEVLDREEDSNIVVNSGAATGLSVQEAKEVITKQARTELDCGGYVCSDRSRDWLISRQRYWGTPIPMIHCPKYGTMPVPYEDLPVELPTVPQLSGKGASPLLSDQEWRKVKCPK